MFPSLSQCICKEDLGATFLDHHYLVTAPDFLCMVPSSVIEMCVAIGTENLFSYSRIIFNPPACHCFCIAIYGLLPCLHMCSRVLHLVMLVCIILYDQKTGCLRSYCLNIFCWCNLLLAC